MLRFTLNWPVVEEKHAWGIREDKLTMYWTLLWFIDRYIGILGIHHMFSQLLCLFERSDDAVKVKEERKRVWRQGRRRKKRRTKRRILELRKREIGRKAVVDMKLVAFMWHLLCAQHPNRDEWSRCKYRSLSHSLMSQLCWNAAVEKQSFHLPSQVLRVILLLRHYKGAHILQRLWNMGRVFWLLWSNVPSWKQARHAVGLEWFHLIGTMALCLLRHREKA